MTFNLRQPVRFAVLSKEYYTARGLLESMDAELSRPSVRLDHHRC